VVCHVTLLGGAFGRKSKPDFIAERRALQKTGRPVKVVWSREDDIKFGYYNAVAAMYMKAALDAKGKPTAWCSELCFRRLVRPLMWIRLRRARRLPTRLDDILTTFQSSRRKWPGEAHVRIGWLGRLPYLPRFWSAKFYR